MSKAPARGRGRRQAQKNSQEDEAEEQMEAYEASSSNRSREFDEDVFEDQGDCLIDDIYLPPKPPLPELVGGRTGRRLVIDTIECENFKSYGGVCELGPFYKSFNAIVGPNGSGKSNVIDAIVFIFGFRASKIRTKKLNSLIHRSESLPNCEFARVTVNFVNIEDKGDEQMELLEDTRFSVTRIVSKDNSNLYKINNNRVLFKDVSKKLSDHGIDLRYNRFLILQGEVEQISLMKPKAPPNAPNAYGMLEYLEDIIGSSRYKEPLEKLHAKIEQFDNEVNNAETIAKLSYKELMLSKEAKKLAVSALTVENDIKRLRAHVLMFDQHGFQAKLNHLEADFAEIEAKLKEQNDKEAELEEMRAKLDAECKEKGSDHERFKKLQTDSKAKLDELSAKDYFIHQKTTELTKKSKKLTKAIEEQKRSLEALQETIQPDQSLEQAIEEIDQRREKFTEKLKTIEAKIKEEMEAAQGDCGDLIKQRDALDEECSRLRDQQKDKLSQMNKAKNVFMVQKKSLEAAQAKLEQIEAKLTKTSQDLTEKKNLIKRFESEIPNETRKQAELKKSREAVEREADQVTAEFTAAKAEMSSLKQTVEKSNSRDRVRNALMGAAAEGKLKGVFGQLRDLGAIDSQYDTAISTACGRLYNFVTDTMDNAQKAVEYMKANNLPPVTFIALDKLRAEWQDTVRYDEGVPRLFDLVRIQDQRFRKAFYFALGETVVAKDLDQATRLGYGKHRLRTVTLNGAIIEPDGSMTGGGQPRSGGMSDRIEVDVGHNQQVIEQLKNKVTQLQERQTQLFTKIDSLSREITTSETDIATMTERLQKCKLEIAEHQTRTEQLEKSKKQAESELQNFLEHSELAQAEQDYQKAQKILDVELAKFNEKQDEMDEIKKQIEAKLAGRLDPIKEKKKEIEKKLKEAQTEKTKMLSDRKASELKLAKLGESIEADEKAREEAQAQLENFKKEREELEAATAQLNADFEQADQKCSHFESEFSGLHKQLKKVMEKLKALKSERIDVQAEYDKKAKVVKEKRAIIEGLKRELAAIKLEPLGDEHGEEILPLAPSTLITNIMQYGENNKTEPQPGEFYKPDLAQTTASLQRIQQHQQSQKQPQEEKMEVDGGGDSDTDASTENEDDERMEHDGEQQPEANPFQVANLSEEELDDFNREETMSRLKQLEEELKKMTPDFSSIETYLSKRKDYAEKFNHLDVITCRREAYRQLYKRVWEDRRKEFRVDFNKISRHLQTLYQTLSLGGDATLEYVNTIDPYDMGINFAVRPNRKAWKVNTSLSGGEKTLASLALIFALHYYKPSPLYIMDEIDAALDFKNVSIIANYVKKRTTNTQFLIISLRTNMYDLCDRMIGIYKIHNITRSITFDPREFEKNLEQEKYSQAVVHSSQIIASSQR